MIGTLCVIIRRPKGEEASTLGIRTSWATYTSAIEATTLFIEDGVFNALDNPCYNTSLLKDLLNEGGKVYCYDKSMSERGLSEDDIMDGIELISDDGIAEMIEENEATLTF